MGCPSNFVQELSGAALIKLLSFLFWAGLYLKCAVGLPRRSPEWCSRVVTLLHGSVATIVGLSQCKPWNLTPQRLTVRISSSQYALMIWSWGYFAFDLLWCLVYGTEGNLMLAHHGMALAAISMYMQKENTGCTYACTVALLEITNPLLQTRWFLRDQGYDKSMIFTLVEVLYLTLFVFLRVILGTYLFLKILKSDLFVLEEKIISTVFYLVSILFVYEIMGYALHKYKIKPAFFRSYFVGLVTRCR